MTTTRNPAPRSASAPRKFSMLAAATLVTGFFGFCCLPLLMGPVALLQMRQTGEKGHGMAIAGMVASLAWIVGLTALN